MSGSGSGSNNSNQQSNNDLIPVPPVVSGEDELDRLFRQDPDTRSVKERREEDDLEGRKALRGQVVSITETWIGFVIVITALQFMARLCGTGLESEEYIALITTTTLGLFGLWRVVGKSLYPLPNPKADGDDD